MNSDFKKGDKFIIELGDRQLDEFKIAGTEYYIKIYLLKQLTPYKPENMNIQKITKHKTDFSDLDDTTAADEIIKKERLTAEYVAKTFNDMSRVIMMGLDEAQQKAEEILNG